MSHTPTPQQIRDKRHAAHLTQTQAAALVYRKLRTWQDWEAGSIPIDLGLWELFCIKVKQ